MATWLAWLSEKFTFPPNPPEPGTRNALLEQKRVGGQLNPEACKPPGERDEELVHKLRVEYRTWGLANAQAMARQSRSSSIILKRPAADQCCAAHAWVQQRAAVSYEASHDYYNQVAEQFAEMLAAAEARRVEVVVAQPSLRLQLPEALQQSPPRLDMCSKCARSLEEIEVDELACREHADFLKKEYQKKGLRAAPSVADSGPGAAGPAAVAAGTPVAKAQQAMAGSDSCPALPAGPAGGTPLAKAQQAQQAQQQRGGCDSSACRTECGPATPKQPPPPQQQQQQQQPSSDLEQDLQQQLASSGCAQELGQGSDAAYKQATWKQ